MNGHATSTCLRACLRGYDSSDKSGRSVGACVRVWVPAWVTKQTASSSEFRIFHHARSVGVCVCACVRVWVAVCVCVCVRARVFLAARLHGDVRQLHQQHRPPVAAQPVQEALPHPVLYEESLPL